MTTTDYLTGLRITRLETADTSGWYLSFASPDTATFDEARYLVRCLPEHQRRWVGSEKAWWVASSALRDLCDVMPDIGDAFSDWHSGNRATGSGSSSQRSTSSRRSSPRIPAAVADALDGVPSDTADAFAALDLLPTASVELVKAARRIAAKRLHPDHGGAHTGMVRANLAAEQALLWAEAREEQNGGGVMAGLYSAAPDQGDACLGCLHMPPRAGCDCCTRPAVKWLAAGRCQLALCRRCYRVFAEWRAENAAKAKASRRKAA